MMRRMEEVLIGESEAMRRLRERIERVAPAELPVLVKGETGTGKELVAKALHDCSGRRGDLIAFNVCAIAESMFEDALFGHVRGAYTGASEESQGFLREADGGTAFFDEIGALPLGSQAKLLRALETGVFRPVGGKKDARSTFRLVAASDESIDTMVDAGGFRLDLVQRLSGIVLHVPPLRERIEDVPMLAAHFAERALPDRPQRVTGDAMAILKKHPWRGNVRELRQVIGAAAVLANDVIDAVAIEQALAPRLGRLVQRSEDAERRAQERDALLIVLDAVQWDVSEAARRAGVDRATVYRRLRRLAIERPERTNRSAGP